MKLLNYTLSYLSVALLVVIGVWAVIFYVNMLDEIYDSIDDGLENSKLLIIQKVKSDSSLLHKTEFLESNYAIHRIPAERAYTSRDIYFDSVFYMQNEEDFEPVRMLKTAFRSERGHYYELLIASSMVEEDDLIADLLYAIIVLYCILLVSVILINNFLLKRLWRPFYSTLEKLKAFNLESNAASFSPPRSPVSEFNELNKTVTALLERSVQTFVNQKQFIENAAHELQTPLATSINKLELLLERNSLSAQQAQEIVSVTRMLERLTRMNRDLLLLSKIENRQFPEEQTVDLNETADRIAGLFADLADYKDVNVSLKQEARISKKMNAGLAEALLSNLVKNAIVHNTRGGLVTIRITATSIIVSNTGDAPALDPSKVFERFYKSSREKTSTGLGLAIAKSIADYYGWRIDYHYDRLHSFIIHFS